MSVTSIKDFPLHVQERIKEQLRKEKLEQKRTKRATTVLPEEEPKAKSKYNNQKTVVSGIVFDSKKEAQRYEELLLLLKSGEISDLRLQVDFTLQEAYTTYTGERIRAIRYKADFTYVKNGEKIVEDVKSKATKTQVYQVKRKMLIERFGVKIIEI